MTNNTSDYLNSIARVSSGNGSQVDHDRVAKAAKQAGSMGNNAREAQRNAGK